MPTLANEFGIDESLVQQRLVRWHRDERIIRLEKCDEQNLIKPIDQWASEERFFTLGTDSGHIRIHLTDKGDELLERLMA